MSTSVVIPVRNQPGCLNRTLRSLTAQSGAEPFDVVVVDDGSTDDTPDVAASYAGRLPLTLLRNPVNQGRSATRNRGAAAAGGDRLILIDADSFSAPDLVARHQRAHAEHPNDVVFGRRLEIGWWSLGRLDAGETLTRPLVFEGDQRDERGLSDTRHNYVGRMPWLFAATHNLSVPAALFAKVGGFDEELTTWGYEDNEFAYRVQRYLENAPGEFQYDAEAVCYHLPHFRDWTAEWANVPATLAYMKNKFRHYDVEFMRSPPNHGHIAQMIPYYERGIAHVAAQHDPAALAAAADAVEAGPGRQLWIGCHVTGAGGRRIVAFDHARPRGEDNYHLFGAAIPYPDSAFDTVVGVDLWRVLNPIDLSSFLLDGLRVAGSVHLVMSRHIGSGPDRLGLIDDFGYVVAMLRGRYTVDVLADDDRVAVLRCRVR